MKGSIGPLSTAVVAILASLPWTALACSNKNAVLGVVETPASPTVSLGRDVQPIFSASCATAFCHGAPLAAPMSLQSSDTFSSLVGVPSCEAPALRRVESRSAATSYLIVKLEGTQSTLLNGGGCAACDFGAGSVSNCGGRMPLTGPPYLFDAEIQLMRDWIDQGAKDN